MMKLVSYLSVEILRSRVWLAPTIVSLFAAYIAIPPGSTVAGGNTIGALVAAGGAAWIAGAQQRRVSLTSQSIVAVAGGGSGRLAVAMFLSSLAALWLVPLLFALIAWKASQPTEIEVIHRASDLGFTLMLAPGFVLAASLNVVVGAAVGNAFSRHLIASSPIAGILLAASTTILIALPSSPVSLLSSSLAAGRLPSGGPGEAVATALAALLFAALAVGITVLVARYRWRRQ